MIAAAMSQLKPDYSRSLVNLMASISAGLGGQQTDYPTLAEVPPAELEGRNVLLMVIDGMGYDFLQRFPDSFLYRHLSARLTSVFPSTTASAMTSYFTAAGPQQHAITGWHTYLKEIGCVVTILPFVPRYGGNSLIQAGYTPAQFFGHAPLSHRLDLPSHVVYPEYIVDSAYSQASSGTAQRHGYSNMADMFRITTELLQQPGPRYVFSYCSTLDNLAHRHGVASAQVLAHFRELDALCEQYLAPLAGSHPMFISADHGLIDTDPAHTIYLDEHPPLAHSLTLPLCGEARAVFCYVHPHRSKAFEEYVRDALGHACTMHSSDELIAKGYFGLGTPHPTLAERVGDYTLLMKDNYVLRDRLPQEKPYELIGVHGGLSPEELFTPLIRL